MKNLAKRNKPLTDLLEKNTRFEFTACHEEVTKSILQELAGPNVLAFPDYEAAISGARKFRVTTDASVEGFGAVLEQQQ